MKLNYLRSYIAFLAITIISIVVLSQALFRSGMIFYGDFSFPITLEKYSSGFQTPSPRSNMAFNYMLPFFALSFALHFSIELLVKLMLLVGLLLTGFSAYFAGREILKEVGYFEEPKITFASLIGAFFFMFNPWSMDRIGHYFQWIGYALSPLILVLGIRMTKNDRLNYRLVFITALVWSIASISPFGALSATILLFSWVFYSTVLAALSKQYKKIVVSLEALALASLFYLLFNFHWIFSYTTSSLTTVLTPPYIVSWENVQLLSRNSNFLNVFELVGNWWPQVQYWPNASLYIPWMLASVLIPLIAIMASLTRRSRCTLYLLLVFFFSITLSMGPIGPFHDVYKWLIFGAPFSEAIGWVFREPDKWNGLTALAYSFLIGISLSAIVSHNFKQINLGFLSKFRFSSKHVPTALAFFCLLALFVMYSGPTVYGYFTQIYRPVDIPQEYYHVNNWLESAGVDSQVLWLAPLTHGTPLNGMLRYSWAPDKPYTPLLDVWSSAKPSLVPSTSEAQRYTNFLYNVVIEGNAEGYLNSLGIKYIIYHNDIFGAENIGQLDIQKLKNQSELELVWSEGFIYVFQTASHPTRISVTSKILALVGGLNSLTTLHSILSLNSSDSEVLFLEQKFYGESILNIVDDAVIVNKNVSDLAMSFLNARYLITPFKHTIHADPFKGWAKTSVYEDWWNWPSPKDSAGYWDWDYGLGLVKTTVSNAQLVMSHDIDLADNYSVWIRYLESPFGGEVSLSVDDYSAENVNTLGEGGFMWRKIGLVHLTSGKHNLILKNNFGFNAINIIALVPSSTEEHLFNIIGNFTVTHIFEPPSAETNQPKASTKSTLNGVESEGHELSVQKNSTSAYSPLKNSDKKNILLFTEPVDTDTIYVFHLRNKRAVQRKESAEIVNYAQTGPTEWVLDVNASEPFLLKFAELYDPFWTAYSDNFRTQSLPLNSVINGFFINRTGFFKLLIRYEPQFYFTVGTWVAVSSIAISGCLVIISTKRGPRLFKIIARLFSMQKMKSSVCYTRAPVEPKKKCVLRR